MLVLARKVGETIVIDSTVRITVVRIVGDKVRLGITAPADVPVDRQEVHALKQAQRPKGSSYLLPNAEVMSAGGD
jgi:carbon storage regulator